MNISYSVLPERLYLRGIEDQKRAEYVVRRAKRDLAFSRLCQWRDEDKHASSIYKTPFTRAKI